MAIDFGSSVNFSNNGVTRLSAPSTGGVRLGNQPIFIGTFNLYTAATSNFSPTLTTYTAQNVTINAGNTTITVPTTGLYYIHAQQLINSSTAIYLSIFKNGVEQKCAYVVNGNTYDMVVGGVFSLNAGDVISFYYAGTLTYGWNGAHSSVFLYLIG